MTLTAKYKSSPPFSILPGQSQGFQFFYLYQIGPILVKEILEFLHRQDSPSLLQKQRVYAGLIGIDPDICAKLTCLTIVKTYLTIVKTCLTIVKIG